MLRAVEINPTELCNRRCSFCPRHDSKLYPDTNNHISVDTVKNLCTSLRGINFNNRVGFVGFGEPLLHENIYDCIKVVRDMLPDLKWLEINTNGDLLDSNTLENLHRAGCSHIAVSMYDEDITSRLMEMRGDTPINFIFRHHYDESNNYNLNIVNRSELLKGSTKNYFDTPCHIPFYKALIDWNGDVLLCNNDWKRSKIYGNINEISFDKIWFGDELIEHGIGPKYAEILMGAGVTTFAQIAAMSDDEIVTLVKDNGGRKSASMGTWAEQAKLAAAGDWDGLAKLQDELSGGRR